MPSSSSSPQGCYDSLDSMIDFGDYERKYEPVSTYPSPSMSPAAIAKSQFTRPETATPAMNPMVMPGNQQVLSGPSHQYELYKQQTGIPNGAIASTLAVNQQNAHINQAGYGLDYFSGADEYIDFDTAPPRRNHSYTNSSDVEMEYYREQSVSSAGYVDPSAIGGQEVVSPPTLLLPTQSGNVGRLWPGMHQQQAAFAKAQAQQKQQQQIIQQQRMQAQMVPRSIHQSRPRGANPPADPIVEEKISQLLNSMRQSSVPNEPDLLFEIPAHTMAQVQQRMRKDEEEMDEDERLLASEEGKKLSSKERRQLRNKVSARAFRSRRKEYIGQLEGEIAVKVNENNDLRSQNRALKGENQRLSDLTRMLLSSPSFSGFLDTLSQNPAAPQQQQQQQQQQPEQRQPEPHQVHKDINPYAAQQQMQHHGLPLISEQSMDFSMMDINSPPPTSYNYQPQVFAILELPEEPMIDTALLSGKTSNFLPGQHLESEDEKIKLPIISRQPESIKSNAPAPITSAPIVDEQFDNDPEFALFVDSPPPPSLKDQIEQQQQETSLFAGITSEKALARIELITAPQDEATSAIALARVMRLCESLDEARARLEALTMGL